MGGVYFFQSKHLVRLVLTDETKWLGVVYFFNVLKQLVYLVLTAEGWWYIRQSIDFALSPHDVMNCPNAPPPDLRSTL